MHNFFWKPLFWPIFSKTLILHHPLKTVRKNISKKPYFYRLKKGGQVIDLTVAKLLTLKWAKCGQAIDPEAYFIYIYRHAHIHTHTHPRTHARTHTRTHTHRHMHAHTHTHTYVRTHTHTHTRTDTHTHTHKKKKNKHTHTKTNTHTHTHTRMRAHPPTHPRARTRHTHTHTHTHTHPHTHTHTHSSARTIPVWGKGWVYPKDRSSPRRPCLRFFILPMPTHACAKRKLASTAAIAHPLQRHLYATLARHH